MSQTQEIPIRPYARLLTMLGEQLIKNERIALVELIKNSYDADSPWVTLSFCNFADDYSIISTSSKIIVEDAGCGMTEEIITKHWLNPATPEKKLRKNKNQEKTKGNRILQGEKGIGRFAILKLGRKIDVITRAVGDDSEYLIQYDLTRYDDDFLEEDKKQKELFIDDIKVKITKRTPIVFIPRKIQFGATVIDAPANGTRIEIAALKGAWSEEKLKEVAKDIAYLQSIFDSINPVVDNKKNQPLPFNVKMVFNGVIQNFRDDYIEKLLNLLTDNSVFRIENGIFSQDKAEFQFSENDIPKKISLSSSDVRGLHVFRKKFGEKGEILEKRKLECGSFSFEFFIFDFSTQTCAKHRLDKNDKDIIKEHRIYLYRDGIRVYPYGDPTDDWLQIDAYRGTISAGQFLSNDQVVGYVNITQRENPNLKDKTNREGLIDEGNATNDFIALLQIFLAYIRQIVYRRYRDEIGAQKVQDIFKNNEVERSFDDLKLAIGDANPKAQKALACVIGYYKQETAYLRQRAETTEELAGVGLSVETASHDIMGFMSKVLANIDGIIKDIAIGGDIQQDELIKDLQSIRGGMSFIEAQLKDIQLLFKSSKQRRRPISVAEIISKVEYIYRRLLSKENITFKVHKIGSPLMAKTTDAVLLQLLLNLFDNAVYWLQTVNTSDKRIEILLDGDRGILIFSDNGPGISAENRPYIFEPFYSGKGEDGRGLGLYIARQLLSRHDYSIDLADISSEKKLSGANFVVNFVTKENGE